MPACKAATRPVCAALIRDLAPETRDPDNAEFLRALLVLGGALFVLTIATYLATTNWAGAFPRDKATLVLGRDFLNLWMYGRALFEGGEPARFYDVATYNDALAHMLGAGYPGQNWPNPPTALVVMAPFGLLELFPRAVGVVRGERACLLSRRPSRSRGPAHARDRRGVAGGAALRALRPKLVADDGGAACDLRAARQAPYSRGRADRAAHGQAAARHPLSLCADRIGPLARVLCGRRHRAGAARGQRRARRHRELACLHRQGAAAAARGAAGCRRHRDAVPSDHLHEYPRARRQPCRRDHPVRFHARCRRRRVGRVPLSQGRRPAHAAGAVLRLHGVGLALYGRLRSAAADLCRGRADRRGEARRAEAGGWRSWCTGPLPCNCCSERCSFPDPASSRRCLRRICCSGCSGLSRSSVAQPAE